MNYIVISIVKTLMTHSKLLKTLYIKIKIQVIKRVPIRNECEWIQKEAEEMMDGLSERRYDNKGVN